MQSPFRPPLHATKPLKGSGRIVTETRDVGSFHAVEAGSIAHVLVGDYPAGRVTVKTDDNLLVHVQTSVAEGRSASDWQTSRCKTPN